MYAVSDPSVSTQYETETKRRKHPKALWHHVSQEIDITRADNWMEPNGQWHFPVMDPRHQRFDAHRDTAASALGLFKTFAGHTGKEIGKEEYERLRSEYDAEAQANVPPKSPKDRS